jgi:Protein of unknown function (DUF3574)
MCLRALLLGLLLSVGGCAHVPPGAGPAPVTASLHGDAERPAQAQGWVRSELYFGVATEGDEKSAIAETQWRAFLDREVTPRFPDGLTVFDAYGQWLFRGRTGPERQNSKVLVILHEHTPQRMADIEAIRWAWKRVTGHQSVLWSRQAAEVSF